MTGGLLWYGHKCMKGKDDLEEELYEGTSKSMEGSLAEECYKQAVEEGCKISVVWQDGDSSSALAVSKHIGEGKVFKCAGHVGRAHAKNLSERSKLKTFSSTQQATWKDKFPEMVTAKCKCTKRHSPGCGCLSKAFILQARINPFFLLAAVQGSGGICKTIASSFPPPLCQ